MLELDVLKKNGFSLDDLEKLRMKLISEGADANENELKEIEELKNVLQSSMSDKLDEHRKRLAVWMIAPLIKELVGDRSIRKTAKDSGVAASYISGILKHKYLPSAEILRKLTLPEAKPQNGVGLQDLMKAAGYISDEQTETSVNPEYTEHAADIIANSFMKKAKISTSKTDVRNEKLDIGPSIENKDNIGALTSMMAGILYRTLSEKGIMFSSIQNVDWKALGIADMAIYVSQKPILEWWFDFDYLKHMPDRLNDNQDDYHRRAHRTIISQINELVFLEPRADRKVSIVINNLKIFRWAQKYVGKLSYRGDLSLILIDMESLSVTAEVYLSHYSDQDTSSEFYIV